MMNRTLSLLFVAALAAGCSSAGKKLDQKLADEPAPANRRAVLEQADQKIAADTTLTAEQKQRLGALKADIAAQSDAINKQSLKLRSVLIEEILSPNYSIDEVNLIKGRLKKLEDQRLSLVFDGVDKANGILGRDAPTHKGMMRALHNERAEER